EAHVADRRVAGDNRRQIDLDRARYRRLRQVEQRLLQGRQPLGQRQPPGRSIGADRLVETYLRAVNGQGKTRLPTEIHEARAFGGIGIVERSGLEQEFVEGQPFVVERELALDAEAGSLGRGRRVCA